MHFSTAARLRRLVACALALLMLGAFAIPASAVPTLTPQGIAAGFTLTQFASNFPITAVPCCGPLGIAFPTGGGVLVSDYPGNVRLFTTDVDGQNAASFPVAQNYGAANAVGIGQIGNRFFMTQQAAGKVVEISPSGTFVQEITTGIPSATGIIADPANGVLYVSDCCNGTGIWRIDVATKTKTQFKAGIGGVDGLAISPNGGTLYAEVNGAIVGYRTSDGAQVYNSGGIGAGPDGTALGFGTLAGTIFVNTNGGTVLQYWLDGSKPPVTIVTGGTRGDFVTADPNGSLLFTQTSDIWRLTAAAGGCIGNACEQPPGVPEPATGALLLVGIAGLAAMRRRFPRIV